VHQQVERLNAYSTLAARTAWESGRRFRILPLLVSPLAAFLKIYVVKRGALDGMRGLIVAVDHAHYVFLKSAKLWDRTRRPDPAFARRVPKTDEDPNPGAPYSG
jgi:hypothetical protein